MRRKNKLSQEDVAREVHVSRQAVSQWESGKTSPDTKSIKLLCKLYGISASELIGEEPIEKAVTDECVKQDSQNQDYENKQAISEILKMRPVLEGVSFAIILAILSQLPVLGIPLTIVLMIVVCVKEHNWKKKIIYLSMCLIALWVCATNTYGFLSYYITPDDYTTTIEPL